MKKEEITAAAEKYATKFETQASSEGLENIALDFTAGAEWMKEQLSTPIDGWISVKDRLPEVSILKRILVYGRRENEVFSFNTTFYFGNGVFSGMKEVAYWIDIPVLPPAPKELTK